MVPDHEPEPGGRDRIPSARTTPGRVRPARPGDSLPLHRLQRHLPDPSPSLLEFGLTASGSGGGTVLVSLGTAADGTGSVVGYVLFIDGPTARHVAELVVAPEFRREGRGRELLSAVRVGTDAPVTLLVAVENEAARSLYESCSFRAVERLPGEYGDGDAVRYRAAAGGKAEPGEPR